MNVLYILMRTDMDSLNPGKAMAQASHASNAFVYRWGKENMVKEWQGETQQGFGTVLVLGVTGDEMYKVVDTVKEDLRFKEEVYADIIHDPTYPVQDGDVVHHIPVDTLVVMFLATLIHWKTCWVNMSYIFRLTTKISYSILKV